MLVSYIECVLKIKPIRSIVFCTIYGAVCIQLTNFCDDDFQNMGTSSIIIIKSEFAIS